MIKRFDLVKLRTTQNVHWMSGPSGRPASVNSIWSVVAGIDGDKLLLSSNQTMIIIPQIDVVKIADYGLEHTFSYIKNCRISRKDKEKKPNGEEGRRSN